MKKGKRKKPKKSLKRINSIRNLVYCKYGQKFSLVRKEKKREPINAVQYQ